MKLAAFVLVIIVVATGIAAAVAMIWGMRYGQGIALMAFSATGWAVPGDVGLPSFVVGAMDRRAEPNHAALFWNIVFMGILAGMAFLAWATHPES